jgi:hypothetical protein
VRDWYKTLNERDRKLLKENFLLELKKLSKNDLKEKFPINYVFESMGLRAFSEELAPMIAFSLMDENFVNIEDKTVQLTPNGLQETDEIEKIRHETWKNTMKRLGY